MSDENVLIVEKEYRKLVVGGRMQLVHVNLYLNGNVINAITPYFLETQFDKEIHLEKCSEIVSAIATALGCKVVERPKIPESER